MGWDDKLNRALRPITDPFRVNPRGDTKESRLRMNSTTANKLGAESLLWMGMLNALKYSSSQANGGARGQGMNVNQNSAVAAQEAAPGLKKKKDSTILASGGPLGAQGNKTLLGT